MTPAGSNWVNTTISCKYNQVLLMMGEKHGPKHVEPTRDNKLTFIVASCWLLS